ncbi:AVAST type 1 anti-phage system protein Avs1c [Roseivirga pacifica]|uniref:AVAST type 1 anti-phage system protein Avs1c n=1 Tax=Roseivirga pacifica TaxID=1267423 RepID=UPI003BB03367
MFEVNRFHIESRKEYERLIHITSEQAMLGRVTFNYQAKKSRESLLKVRSVPNRRVDLSTVNELARTTINAVSRWGSNKNFEDEEG